MDIYQSIHHSHIISRERLVLTLSILPCPRGWISWSIPVDGLMMRRMSILHQNSGGIGKSIWSALDPRDFLRAREISWQSGIDFPIPPEFWWSMDILLIINPSTGMDPYLIFVIFWHQQLKIWHQKRRQIRIFYRWCAGDKYEVWMDQEIHACGQGRIDSVKINPSLLRMREWLTPLYCRYCARNSPSEGWINFC